LADKYFAQAQARASAFGGVEEQAFGDPSDW